MGESTSACLVRSFSQPSQERSEGDPLRALTASVSFGRFMNESLAWEKWSSFTHNRYQEEVEKYSRPGSVAEKKAYFEAQFKRAAAKKAAALLEQQNAAVGVSTDLNVTNQINVHSTVDSELTGTSSYVGADEAQREEGDVTNQPIDDSPMEFEFTENGSYEVTEEAQGGEGHLNVTNPNLDHRTTCSELPENSSYVGVEEAQGDDGDNTSAFGSYATHEKSNLELAETENSAEQSYPIENEVKSLNQAENVVVEVNENIIQLKKKKKTQTKNASMAGDSVLSLKKKPLSTTSRLTNNNESSKLRSRVKPMTPLALKVTDNRKNGKDLIDKKRSNPKSLQTLIKFSSHKEETKKTLSPVLEKIMNSRLVRSITKTSRDGKVQETSALASVSGISKRTSETPQRENRRTRTKLDQPFCKSDTEKGELLSHSGNFESINENGNRTCSRTVFSPFILRSEERAAKRREFFQKLEQKLNTKEAKKQQLHAKPKEKATSSSKVLISRAKPNPSIHHERESFTNQTKKEIATSSSKVLTSRAKPNAASIQHERESFTNQTKKEKDTSSSKVLTSKAKPNAGIQLEREPSSNQMKKEKATSSSFKELTSRAKPNASIHHERELSSYQMKKMPRQPCSPKFIRKSVSEVQDNKSRQPWRLLGKPYGSKDVKRENNLPKENASPNIQV
ncbi:PREDICTED: protein WVD2-like 7 isoform X2 [Nicotiana attenuata]|uniref:protein WVD2-like 7 isoform X2 n=1 Tax=Nicotiana attenuata TaxID=49451 RepID=UPI000904EFD8|nr:PREDICTED: protein WVD2-like 7 isoform X2 [Nicotiana attenuata]